MDVALNKEVVSKMSDDEIYAHIESIRDRLKKSIDANYGMDVGLPPLTPKEHYDLWDLLIQLVIYVENRRAKENAEP